MADLPPPPIDSSVDLRTFDDMPLDVRALRDSDTAAEASDEAFRAAVMLWCAAWHQIPASSLPDDDAKLARLAGYGRDLRGWKRVKTQALRGFQLCSDGRLYHLYMVGKAKKAWARKNEQKQKASGRWNNTKPLKKKKTDDAPAYPTAEPQQSHGTSPGNAPAMPLNRGDLSPPKSPPSSTPGSATGPSAHADRPPTSIAQQDPYSHGFVDKQNRVVIHQPDGVILKISDTGAVDLISHDREAAFPQLTTEQALDLRTEALAPGGLCHISQPVESVLRTAKASA